MKMQELWIRFVPASLLSPLATDKVFIVVRTGLKMKLSLNLVRIMQCAFDLAYAKTTTHFSKFFIFSRSLSHFGSGRLRVEKGGCTIFT